MNYIKILNHRINFDKVVNYYSEGEKEIIIESSDNDKTVLIHFTTKEERNKELKRLDGLLLNSMYRNREEKKWCTTEFGR
jgi:hypothetical protein